MTMSFLPEQSTLEPNGGKSPPNAVYIRLTNDALDSILAGQGNNVRLSLGQRMELKVGDKSFSTSSVSEACPIDLYKQRSSSQFRNIGSVTHRITVQKSMDNNALSSSIKNQNKSLAREKEANKATLLDTKKPASLPGSPAPSSTASTNKHRTLQIAASKPLSSQSLSSGPNRVVHLLALGPTTSQTIANRTNLPAADVDNILDQYANKKDDNSSVFVLADNRYKELRVWDWKHYSSDERRKVIADSKAAFDRLNVPEDHSARKNLIDPKLRKQTPKASPQPSPKPSTPTPTNNTTSNGPVKRPGAILKTGTTKKSASKPTTPLSDSQKNSPARTERAVKSAASSPSGNNGTGATKRKTSPSDAGSAASAVPAAKKQKSTVDEDLFELARKFRQAYGEYAKLYTRMSSSAERKKSKADVQKLLSMHRELQSWKNKLWSIAPSSSKSLV